MPDTWTSQQRMRAALGGQLPDRVPFFPTIYVDHAAVASGRRFEDFLLHPAIGPECMLRAALRHQTDAVRFMMGLPRQWFEDKIVKEEDGAVHQYDRRTGRRDGYFDVAGGGGLHLDEPPAGVRTVAAARAIPVMPAADYAASGCLDAVIPQIANAHRHGLFVVGMCAGQTLNFIVTQMGNAADALTSFYDAPEVALALIDKAVALSIEKGKAFIAAGVDGLMIGDSYTSGSVISPEIYLRFCAPAYREVAQEFHRLGVFCYKHCCGNYNPFLEHLPAIGVDAMDGIDPTSGMSVKHAKERIGERVTLLGGISCLTLLNGSPDEVYAEARRCVEAGKPGGRYILGSACAVPRFTPAANFAAARQAALDWGRY